MIHVSHTRRRSRSSPWDTAVTRRDMVRAFALGGLAAILPAPTDPTRHGLLTVRSHVAHKRFTGEVLHVWFNGVDVTRSTYEANDLRGYALVHCRDQASHHDWTAQGAIHIGKDGGACSMRLKGDVRIAPGDDL